MNINKHLQISKYEEFLNFEPIKGAYKSYMCSNIFDSNYLNGVNEFFASYIISDKCNNGFSKYFINDDNLCCCEYDALDTSPNSYDLCWFNTNLLFFIGCLHSSTFNEDLLFFVNDTFLRYCAFTQKAFLYCLAKGLLFKDGKHLEDYQFLKEKGLNQLSFIDNELDLDHNNFNQHMGTGIIFLPENVDFEYKHDYLDKK